MTDEEEEKPFAIERAKSGRAKCKKCKCPIEKDTTRIAKLVSNPFSEGTKMKAWYHLSCLFEVFAKQRATTRRIEDPEEDISGWDTLLDEDKKAVVEKIEEFERNSPVKITKPKTSVKKKEATTTSKKKMADIAMTSSTKKTSKEDTSRTTKNRGTVDDIETNEAIDDDDDDDKNTSTTVEDPTKDDLFREFRRTCARIANVDAYTEKTAIVKKMFTVGSTGDRFKSDIVLWCKLLLPQAAKRIYNLQSKQLIKLFARILHQDEEDMLEHLEQGDVAETVRIFFESSTATKPSQKSLLTIWEVDAFLERLSRLTKEDEQIDHLKSIVGRCTGNDLKMIIRLIKRDLRINAGPKHILGAVSDDAYKAFQVSMNLEAVVERCAHAFTSSPKTSMKGVTLSTSPDGKVALTLMTPVLPMLAEACKSVEMAMRKCPNGMLAEIKYDGERVQVHKKSNEFRFFSRSLKPVMAHKINHFNEYIPRAFPDGDDLILDSEILLIDTKTGKPLPFGSLGVHKRSEFKDANVCLFVFDCIYYNGEILIDRTMQERRKILKERMTEIPNRIMLSEVEEVHDPRDLAEMIAKVLRLGLEGLVLKDIKSKYVPGKRYWLKVKKDYLFGGAMADSADLVVLGAWYGTGNKGGMMSVFLMGCHDPNTNKWLTVTKVHTGHDDATLEALQKKLDMTKIAKDPNKVPSWLCANKPMIPDFVAKDPKKQPVWEITGAEFTNQGVHTADGISIRFPRVTRVRDDKDWTTATNLNELRQLFERSSESLDFSLLLETNSSSKKNVDDETISSTNSVNETKTSTSDEAIGKRIARKGRRFEERNRSNDNDDDDDDDEDEDEDEDEEDDKKKIQTLVGKIRVKEEFHIRESDIIVKKPKIHEKGCEYENNVAPFKVDPDELRNDLDIKVEKKMISADSPADLEGNFNNDNGRGSAPSFYSFVGNDYIEYSASGSPLNWIDGRKPKKGLPPDARPLSDNMENVLKLKGVFKDVRASLANDVRRKKRKHLQRILKTLGATILKDADRFTCTHVIHDRSEIPSTAIRDFEEIPKTARHVNASWVEESAAVSEMKEFSSYVVAMAADYCDCLCTNRR